MIASGALQKAIYARLNGAITGGVYDEVPPTASAPYTVIGETTERPWDTHDSDGSEETIVLHTWSNKKGMLEVHTIQDEIDLLLHHQSFSLDEGRLVMLRREFKTTLTDESVTGETWRHGVLRYRALISQ